MRSMYAMLATCSKANETKWSCDFIAVEHTVRLHLGKVPTGPCAPCTPCWQPAVRQLKPGAGGICGLIEVQGTPEEKHQQSGKASGRAPRPMRSMYAMSATCSTAVVLMRSSTTADCQIDVAGTVNGGEGLGGM
jgi:hypothetical protein